MKKMFNKKVIAIAAGLFVSQFAFSQTLTASVIQHDGSIAINGNTNNTVVQEGVYIRSNADADAHLYIDTLPINSINVGQIRLGTQGSGGAASLNFTGSAGTINAANLALTGTTSLNTAGTAVTNIGNSTGATNINNGVAGTTNIGTGSAASATNIGNALSTNTIIGATSINGSGTLETNIGTGGGATNIGTAASANTVLGTTSITGTTTINGSGNFDTTIGNASTSTKVTATAGKAQMLLSNTGGTTVDANGKILTNGATGYVNPAAPTAAVTLTNSLGNTHGLVVTESQTTLSGGTQSSSMTLNDRGATFSNAQNGAPITVTGVANGRADFDAVNVRQFAGAIAAVAAQANIPALAAGQDRTFGMGLGNFMGKSALAMGISVRGNQNSVYKATVSSGLNNGMNQTVVGLGGAWGF